MRLTFIITLILSSICFFMSGFYLGVSKDVEAVKSMEVMLWR